MEYIVEDRRIEYAPGVTSTIRVATGEEITRCRECKYCKEGEGFLYCVRKMWWVTVEENGYCYLGERAE